MLRQLRYTLSFTAQGVNLLCRLLRPFPTSLRSDWLVAVSISAAFNHPRRRHHCRDMLQVSVTVSAVQPDEAATVHERLKLAELLVPTV